MVIEQLDKIQKEFIQLYRKIEIEDVNLKPLKGGTRSLWSSGYMFDITPLLIERAWGNLTKEVILNERPNDIKHIAEGIYKDNEIICTKFWNDNKLSGFENLLKMDNNTIQTTRVIIDDDEQELASIAYCYKNEKGLLIKMLKAHKSGATLEEYEYVDDAISKLTIQRRDEFEVKDNPDGITKVPINKIIYKIEYNPSGKLTGIINEKGKNIYRKPKYKKRLKNK